MASVEYVEGLEVGEGVLRELCCRRGRDMSVSGMQREAFKREWLRLRRCCLFYFRDESCIEQVRATVISHHVRTPKTTGL